MAKKLGKLFTLAVTAGTAAAAAYYYLQNKKAAVQEAPEEEDDFEKDPEDDFDDTDFTDDDFVDESEHPEEAKEEKVKEDTPVFSSETKEDGHTYVTLDLKAAQDKAAQLRDTVFNKVGDTVSRIKNSSEYETVTGKIKQSTRFAATKMYRLSKKPLTPLPALQSRPEVLPLIWPKTLPAT